MRILLRQRRTGLYLQPSGEWQSNRVAARNFQRSSESYSQAHQERLLEVVIVLAFPNESHDSTIEVGRPRDFTAERGSSTAPPLVGSPPET